MVDAKSHRWSHVAILASFLLLLTACSAEDDLGAEGDGVGEEGGEAADDSAGEGEDGYAFFEGESVEVLVPFGPGGGTDTTARFMAPRFEEELGIDMQVVNVEGGGSVLGMNEYMLEWPEDGYNWAWSSGSTHLPYQLGQNAVEYEFADLEPVMGTAVGNVVIAHTDLGVDEPADLLDVEGIVAGGGGPIGADTVQLLGYEVLGLEHDVVLGFDGRGPERVAFEQGEINLRYETTPAWFGGGGESLEEEGIAVPLWTAGQLEGGEIVRDPEFPDLPSIKEVHEEMYGEAPSGPEWEAYKSLVASLVTFSKVLWIHDDAPTEAHEGAATAVENIVSEPDFSDEAADAIGTYPPLRGEGLSEDIRDALTLDDDVSEWLSDWLVDNFDVDIE